MTTQITNQRDLRRLFWEAFPELLRRRVNHWSGKGTMYPVDTRMAFIDWLDEMQRDGQVSEKLAQKATL